MAKSKSTVSQTHNTSDALIVDRAAFKAKLIERIDNGRELLERSITNEAGLQKNDKDFNKWDNYNIEYLKQAFNNEENEYKYQYERANFYTGMFGGGNTPNERLKLLKKYITNKVDFLENILEKADLLKSEIKELSKVVIAPTIKEKDNHNIFIVHGHNTAMQVNVARTREKLGLTPIILHEQPNAGKTIIEKFESNSNVGFSIVLLTDDDEGKSKAEIELKSRARQNVVLELGYFIGKLGRNKVLPLYSEGVELPSDIHGLLYVLIDNANTWKFALVKELKAAGYSVDANAIL